MEKAQKILNGLCESGVKLNDYYSITLTRYEIGLQAHFNSSIITKMRNSFGVEFKIADDMVKAQFEIEGVLIKIVLT